MTTELDARGLEAVERQIHEVLALRFDIGSFGDDGGISKALALILANRPLSASDALASREPVRYLYEFVDVMTGTVTEEVSKVDRSGEPRVSNVRPLYTVPPPADRDRLAADLAEAVKLLDAFSRSHDEAPGGLLDCMDNNGERYTSQFLFETIGKAHAFIARKETSDGQ